MDLNNQRQNWSASSLRATQTRGLETALFNPKKKSRKMRNFNVPTFCHHIVWVLMAINVSVEGFTSSTFRSLDGLIFPGLKLRLNVKSKPPPVRPLFRSRPGSRIHLEQRVRVKYDLI